MITPAALRVAYAAGDTIRLATAGTSGRPRWVVRTAASWVDSFPVVAQVWGLSTGSRGWVPGPVAASMNAYAVCLLDHVGATLVHDHDHDHGPGSHVFATPTLLGELLDHDHPPATMIIAGDRLAPGLADRAEAAGHVVHHYYGAAQLSFVGWGRDAEALRLFPEVRAEAVDGELWVTSPWLCLREEGSPAVLRTMVRNGETWMSVGDRGRVSDDCRLVVAGRPDAVTTAGATVVLGDVEAALRPYAVGEVVVVGRRHPRLGTVLAAVCTEAGDVEVLRSAARRELPASHRPRAWSVQPRLPVTAAGKIDRVALSETVLSREPS